MTETAVVFGANGFLGRAISDALTARGWRCIGVDRNGHAGNAVPDVPAPYYDGESWSEVALAEFLAAIGSVVVINAAGAAWSTEADVVRRDNIGWARRLGLACELSRSVTEIIHIGSAHEYGTLPEGAAVREADPLAPDSTYASSKSAAASFLVRAAYRMDVPIRIIRPFNMIGPGHGTRGLWSTVVGWYRRAVAEGADRVVAQVADPETARDFVDVRDVARLVSLAVGRPELPLSSVYNAGSGRATTIRELIEAFRAESGIGYEFAPADGPLRPGSRWQCADIEKAASELGWRPAVSLADSVRECLAGAADEEQPVRTA